MKKLKQLEEPEIGLITEPMDSNTEEFKKFQAIILNKVKEQSKEKRLEIELIALKIKMEDYMKDESETVKTAGDFLKSFLLLLNITQKRFAEYTGIEPTFLSKIVNGERVINSEYALIISKIFSTEPLLWLEIQAKNELKIVEKKLGTLNKYSLQSLMQVSK